MPKGFRKDGSKLGFQKGHKLTVGKRNFGSKNSQWKGDKVSYSALHAWVRRNKHQIELCEDCNKNKSFDVANISGTYKRDINDYKWLCRKCHMKSDGRLDNLENVRQMRFVKQEESNEEI